MTKYKFPTKCGKDHPRWNGGRRKVGKYMQILSPNHPHANGRGYVYEHRLVMEQKLGRFLDPAEIVHHVNGDKLDNRPENLEVFENNRIHASLHSKGRHFVSPLKGTKRPDISERQRGKHHSEEWKQNISKALKGNPKVIAAKLGRKLSEEWKHNISLGHKRRRERPIKE